MNDIDPDLFNYHIGDKPSIEAENADPEEYRDGANSIIRKSSRWGRKNPAWAYWFREARKQSSSA